MLFKINQHETKRRVLDFFQTNFYYLEAMAGIKARDILPFTNWGQSTRPDWLLLDYQRARALAGNGAAIVTN